MPESIFNKFAGLKKDYDTVISCESYESFKDTFIIEYLQLTTNCIFTVDKTVPRC